MSVRLVTTLTLSFLIGSSLLFQVPMTNTKSQVGLKLGKIRSGNEQLPALEHLENSHRLLLGEML